MKTISRLSRLWERRLIEPRASRAYEKLLARPDHQIVTVLLTRAVENNADAICIGFHPEIVEEPESKAARLKSAEQFEAWCAIQRTMHPSHRALERNSKLHGPRDEPGIPISMRIDGALRFWNQWPYRSLGMLINAIQSRAVSIGASATNPQPIRFFEIGYDMSKSPITSGVDGRRRFIEADLEYQKDNTFWIYVLSVREIEAGTRVSQTMF